MASSNRSARFAGQSRRGASLKFALGALLSCSVIAGSAWGVASALSAMHEAARVVSEGPAQLRIALTDGRRPDSVPTAVKSSRFMRLAESDIRGYQLTAAEIQTAHKKSVAAQLAMVDSRKKADEAVILASAAPVRAIAPPEAKISDKPSIVTALVEDVPAEEIRPFDLVMAKQESQDDDAMALPSQVPLPEARPLIDPIVTGPKPTDESPLVRKTPDVKDDVAPAQGGGSFFGNLFGRKAGSGAWSGNDRKVAIYDVSNATVYLPDGTKLRAHSGIGSMRDNPRYDHVSMKGPTPAGIYRLSMREQRFYGVEAIRMTSIDGRDPKNRTGLLTHTNLLRGQIGSHGCVAFQNYQPFLNAFKRGQVKTLVVVPELPASPTQLAALYRKAGA